MSQKFMQQCDACQCQKSPGLQYAHLPPREAALLPWEEVALDLIGPWMVKVGQDAYDFFALTCIDHVSYLSDAIHL
jgi:hypothetical protein